MRLWVWIRVPMRFMRGCYISGWSGEVGGLLVNTSNKGTGGPLIVCRTNGSVLLSKRFLIYGLFYTRGVVHVPRGL